MRSQKNECIKCKLYYLHNENELMLVRAQCKALFIFNPINELGLMKSLAKHSLFKKSVTFFFDCTVQYTNLLKTTLNGNCTISFY